MSHVNKRNCPVSSKAHFRFYSMTSATLFKNNFSWKKSMSSENRCLHRFTRVGPCGVEMQRKQAICLAVKPRDTDDIQGNDVDLFTFPDFCSKKFSNMLVKFVFARVWASHFRSGNSVWFVPLGIRLKKENPGCRVFTVASVLRTWWNLRLELRTSVWWDTRPVFTFTALVLDTLCWTQYLSICHVYDERVEWDVPAAWCIRTCMTEELPLNMQNTLIYGSLHLSKYSKIGVKPFRCDFLMQIAPPAYSLSPPPI